MDWTEPLLRRSALWALHRREVLPGCRPRGGAWRLPGNDGRCGWRRKPCRDGREASETQVDRPGSAGSFGRWLAGGVGFVTTNPGWPVTPACRRGGRRRACCRRRTGGTAATNDRSAPRSGPDCRAFLDRRRGGERSASGKASHRAAELRMDWTEPLLRRPAMGVASSGGTAGMPVRGSCVEATGPRWSVTTAPRAFPRPWCDVGDAGRLARGSRQLRSVPGGRRWARHEESTMAGAMHLPAR